MERLTATLLVLILGSTWGSATSASAALTPIEAEPLTHTRGGRVQGCGLRLTGGQAGHPTSSWFDISINLFQRGIGLAQSIAYEISRSEYAGDSRPARVPVQRTWIQAAHANVRLGESVERRESLVYRLLAEDILALFEAVATEQPVTLGVRPWGQQQDSVFTATPVLSEASRKQLSSCLAALSLM